MQYELIRCFTFGKWTEAEGRIRWRKLQEWWKTPEGCTARDLNDEFSFFPILTTRVSDISSKHVNLQHNLIVA